MRRESMSQTKSYRYIFVLAAVIFSLGVIGLWIVSLYGKNSVLALMGASYALLCTGFLVAQLVAFVKAHLDYDQTIEKPKFDILKLEDQEWL